MSLTLFALTLAPLYLKMVLDPSGAMKAFKAWSKNEGVQLSMAFILLILGMFMLQHHGLEYKEGWNSLGTYIGTLVALKGASFLIPGAMEWHLKIKFFKEKNLPMFGFIGLLLVLFLVYADLQLVG